MIARKSRWIAGVAAVLACAGSTWADTAVGDDAKHVQTVIDFLKAGNVPAAVAKLGTGPNVDALTSHPDLVHVLCDRAFRFDSEKANAAARQTLATRLFDLATATAAKAPDDDRTRWALSEAIVLRERTGPRTGVQAWTQAADLLEKVHDSRPRDGLPLSYAVSYLLEGACTDTDAATSLVNRAEVLTKKAADAQRDSPTLAITLGTSNLWAARTLVATNKKASRVALKVAIETLKPFSYRKVPLQDAATIYNDAVVFGLNSAFGLPDRLSLTPRTALEGRLGLDIPCSTRWSLTEVAATEEVPAYEYVTEVDAAGKRLRQMIFRRYAAGQQYTFESTVPCGGDNVRSITQGLQAMSAVRVFAPGAATPPPGRKNFCKALDGYSFEVKGQSLEGGEPAHLYGYVVRGHDQACYAALVYVYGKDDVLGPEMEAVVYSLRDPER